MGCINKGGVKNIAATSVYACKQISFGHIYKLIYYGYEYQYIVWYEYGIVNEIQPLHSPHLGRPRKLETMTINFYMVINLDCKIKWILINERGLD